MRTKYLCITFGTLDIMTSLQYIIFKVPRIINFDGILNITELLLIASLLISGILSLLQKKKAVVIYFIQLPLKILLSILSLNILVPLLRLNPNSIQFKVLGITIIIFEFVRLFYSIKIFNKLKTQHNKLYATIRYRTKQLLGFGI